MVEKWLLEEKTMVINKKIFGEYEGNPVYSYILDNENGLYAEILTFGGIIRRS